MEQEKVQSERTLWIPGVAPGTNDLTEWLTAGPRNRRGVVYAQKKREFSEKVGWFAKKQAFGPIVGPAHFAYHFIEPNRKRDPSNIVGGGIKFLEDALQVAGLLENDGWKHVLSLAVTWSLGESPGVRITVRQ